MRKLSVVVSCFNEEGNIRRFPSDVIGFLDRLSIPYELILIDDGSKDGTLQELNQLALKYPQVKVIPHGQNQGLGAGIRNGINNATGDAILTLDADLTFHPSEIPNLIHAFEKADVVAGSPFLGKLENVNLVRRWLSQIVNFCYGILFGQTITAASSIFRLYKSDLVKSMKLTSRSFDINAEILFNAIQQGAVIVEVPATLSRRQWGESKIGITKEIRNHLVLFMKVLRWRFKRISS